MGSISPHLTSDVELLTNGAQANENALFGRDIDNDISFSSQISLAGRERAKQGERSRFAKECGQNFACQWCLLQLSQEELASQGLVTGYDDTHGLIASPIAGGSLADLRHFVGRQNPFCRKRGSKASIDAFPASGR